MQAIRYQSDSAELDSLRRVLLERLHDVTAKIYLFGSRAEGRARPFSDVDIGIAHDGSVTPAQLSALRDVLDDMNILLTVDLVDLQQASPEFRQRVMRQGVLWKD